MKVRRSPAVSMAGLLLIASLIFTLAGCLGVDGRVAQGPGSGSSDGTGEISTSLPEPGLVSAQQGYEILSALSGDPDFVLLDIRSASEVESLHIPGAVNLDFYSDGFSSRIAQLDRDKIYLIYCRTANRTGQAYGLMADLGFVRVYDLDGGISTWSSLGYPTCQGSLDAPHSCDGSPSTQKAGAAPAHVLLL